MAFTGPVRSQIIPMLLPKFCWTSQPYDWGEACIAKFDDVYGLTLKDYGHTTFVMLQCLGAKVFRPRDNVEWVLGQGTEIGAKRLCINQIRSLEALWQQLMYYYFCSINSEPSAPNCGTHSCVAYNWVQIDVWVISFIVKSRDLCTQSL